jgi:hypothetical protein
MHYSRFVQFIFLVRLVDSLVPLDSKLNYALFSLAKDLTTWHTLLYTRRLNRYIKSRPRHPSTCCDETSEIFTKRIRINDHSGLSPFLQR